MGITSTLTMAATKAVGMLVGSKAVIVVEGEETNPINVQFNPSEYSITDRSVYTEKSRNKKDEPVTNYSGGAYSTLNVKLYFNSDEFFTVKNVISTAASLFSEESSEDMTKTINRISALTRIDGDEHKPPGCVFVWGSLQFAGFAQSVNVTYTMFDKSGKPLRAIVDFSMKGFNAAASERSSPLLSPDRTKARTLTEDSTIWSIAEKEYGSAREWRRIADANDIMNPLDIPVGTVLRVPSINEND